MDSDINLLKQIFDISAMRYVLRTRYVSFGNASEVLLKQNKYFII